MNNLSSRQLSEIKAARSDTHIENLIAIIEDLDKEINLWRESSRCNTPDELETKINGMEDTISSLSS